MTRGKEDPTGEESGKPQNADVEALHRLRERLEAFQGSVPCTGEQKDTNEAGR